MIVAENFQEFQMYVVFEFEDSGHDLESFEVSNHFTGYAVIYCCTYLYRYCHKDTLNFNQLLSGFIDYFKMNLS